MNSNLYISLPSTGTESIEIRNPNLPQHYGTFLKPRLNKKFRFGADKGTYIILLNRHHHLSILPSTPSPSRGRQIDYPARQEISLENDSTCLRLDRDSREDDGYIP